MHYNRDLRHNNKKNKRLIFPKEKQEDEQTCHYGELGRQTPKLRP